MSSHPVTNRLLKNPSWFWVEGSGFGANTPPLVGETGPSPQPRTPNPEPTGIFQQSVKSTVAASGNFGFQIVHCPGAFQSKIENVL